MNIIFDRVAGENLDMIWSLYYMANDEFIRKELDKSEIDPDTEIEEILQTLSKNMNNKEKVEFFFNRETRIFDALFSMEELFGKDLKVVLQDIKKMSEDEIIYRLIKELLSDKFEDKSILENETQIAVKNNNFIDFIKNLNISDGAKWNLFCYKENIKKYVDEVVDLVDTYSAQYHKEMEKHRAKRKLFEKEIEIRIQKEKQEFLNELLRGDSDLNLFDEIYVSASYLHYYSLYFYTRKNKGYIYIGSNYEKLMAKFEGEGELERNLNIFKNLSDKTRYEILKLLLKRDYFGQEIAQELHITTATVSYHMNYLSASRIVEMSRKEHKAFYKLNKETLKECVDFLNRQFELNQ